MSAGRVVAALAASLAVGGCAVVVLGMNNADDHPAAAARSSTVAAPTSRPAYLPVARASTQLPATTGRPAAASTSSSSSPGPTRTAATSVVPPAVAPRTLHTTHAATTARPVSVPAASPAARPSTRVAPRRATPVTRTAPKAVGQRLPLRYSTGSATRVITVTARSHVSTVAILQAWTRVTGGWTKDGSAITAHVGAQGIGTASETTSRTPAGTFTLTQAFGRRSDPGTALPYLRTTPSDYWISDSGRRYNTHQRCDSCGYNDGANERLYYETPYYNYAVVIDYNTRNAPGGVRAGKGSAFFLHVTDGRPTAGCVAIAQSRLVPLMKWLTPSAHPRILIGVV